MSNKRIAIVSARFNDFIVSRLHEGAKSTLLRQGVTSSDIKEYWVPGAFELPLVAQKLAKTKNFDAIICLGCVIRGATTHYDYVCNEVAKGVAKVGLEQELPVIFGVLTTENIEQAIERAGTKAGNKGEDAAHAALEMIQILGSIENN